MLRCEWKKPRWPEIRLTFYLLSTQERNMYEGQDYKHDFYFGKLLYVVVRRPEAASRLSAIHHSYSRIDAQTVNIQFALVSFSCFFFWAKKTPHTVSM